MKKLTQNQIFQELCKVSKKFGLYISFVENKDYNDLEIFEAAPYLNVREDFQFLCDGHMIILCDSEDEMLGLFNKTVGDDGPTKLNKYNGPGRIYAITCSPNGELLNVNT